MQSIDQVHSARIRHTARLCTCGRTLPFGRGVEVNVHADLLDIRTMIMIGAQEERQTYGTR